MSLHNEIKIESIKSPTQVINLICKFAKANNKNALSTLIRSGVCIDIYDGKARASQKIASEKSPDIEALEFLIEEFGASLNYAVEGAARGGHSFLVEVLIKQGAALDYAITGAAHGGHLVLVNDLIKRGAQLNFAVMGAACGGHIDLLNNLLNQGGNVDDAVEGAAQGGHLTIVENLINNEASLSSAVYGAAVGCYFVQIEDLIDCETMLDDAVQGAAMGGCFTLVEDLIHRGASYNRAIAGAALGGHRFMVDNLIICHLAKINDAVMGAARGGHFILVEDLIRRGASLKEAIISAVEGAYFDNEKLALRVLTSLEDKALRLSFAKEVKKYYCISYDIQSLVSTANIICEFKRTKNLSFKQCLAWQDPVILQGLLAWFQLEKYLSRPLSFLAITFLLLPSIKEKELKNLYEKMQFEIRKTDLSADLQNYYLSSGRFFRDKRPKRLRLLCQSATSEDDIYKSIENEISNLTKKDDYFNLLTGCSRQKR